MTWRSKSVAINEYRAIEEQREQTIQNLKVMPSPDNIFLIGKDKKWLGDKEKELGQLLRTKELPEGVLTPLQFKEHLLHVQTKLKQLADIQGCVLQEDLGFAEYTAGAIPQAEEVPLLEKQLAAINELINLSLKRRVSEIGGIRRMPYMYAGPRDLYNEAGFTIEVKCVLEDLLGMLADMINAPYIFIVRDMDVEKLDDKKVAAQMLVGVVEFGGGKEPQVK